MLLVWPRLCSRPCKQNYESKRHILSSWHLKSWHLKSRNIISKWTNNQIKLAYRQWWNKWRWYDNRITKTGLVQGRGWDSGRKQYLSSYLKFNKKLVFLRASKIYFLWTCKCKGHEIEISLMYTEKEQYQLVMRDGLNGTELCGPLLRIWMLFKAQIICSVLCFSHQPSAHSLRLICSLSTFFTWLIVIN